MKKLYNNILLLTVFTTLFGLSACSENSLIFPEQIPLEEAEVNERGPVKQNSFVVINDDDEKIRFNINSVDKELIESVYFSYNRTGEKEVTEVKNFDDLYIIENIPVSTPTAIEVWAKGKNGLDSKKFSYVV